MNYFTHTIRYVLYISVIALSTTHFVFASSIYSEVTSTNVKQGEEFKMDVFLNTNAESVNALEGKILIPKEYFEVTDIQNGSSFITFWLETPEKASLNESGSTTFSGIIPGGYRGEKGYLYSILLRGKKEGNAKIILDNMRVVNTSIVNNVDKTEAEKLSDNQTTITISKEIAPSTLTALNDTIPPEIFKPEISKNNQAYDGKYFIAFVAQDKGVGIDHYEVKEGNWGKYVQVTSPYILTNQNADEIIYIKAIDKKGNTRLESIKGTNWTPWYTDPKFIGLAMILLLLASFYTKKKSRK